MSNLSGVYEHLDDGERRCLVAYLKMEHSTLEVHVGTLPFVNYILAADTLRSVIGKQPNSVTSRKASKILEKMKANKLPLYKFTMVLDDILVFRRSQGNSTVKRVMMLGSKKTVECGMQLSDFGKRYKRVKKQVNNQCVLTRLEHNYWEVTCELDVANSAKRQLRALCGSDFPRLRKIKGQWH